MSLATATTLSPAEAPQGHTSNPTIRSCPETSTGRSSSSPYPDHPCYRIQSHNPQRSSQGQHQRRLAAASNRGPTYQAAIDSCLRGGRMSTYLAKANREIWHHSRNVPGCSGKGCSGCTARSCRQAECGETKRDCVKPLFTLDRVVATPGALAAIGYRASRFPVTSAAILRETGGELDAHDGKENQLSLERSLSASLTGSLSRNLALSCTEIVPTPNGAVNHRESGKGQEAGANSPCISPSARALLAASHPGRVHVGHPGRYVSRKPAAGFPPVSDCLRFAVESPQIAPVRGPHFPHLLPRSSISCFLSSFLDFAPTK
jgi:hypothetical protein